MDGIFFDGAIMNTDLNDNKVDEMAKAVVELGLEYLNIHKGFANATAERKDITEVFNKWIHAKILMAKNPYELFVQSSALSSMINEFHRNLCNALGNEFSGNDIEKFHKQYHKEMFGEDNGN